MSYFAFQIETEFDMMDFLPKELDLSKQIKYLLQEFEGAKGEEADILIEANVANPEVLKKIYETIENIKDDPYIVRSNKEAQIVSIFSVMKEYAKHYKTGEAIPQELIDKLKNSSHFNQGFITLEYLSAAFLDLDWHTIEENKDYDVLEFEKQSIEKMGLIPEIVVRYRSTYFRHIFAGGYSAGYYSYIWAAILDADAFQAFKESSLFDQETAKKFRKNILEVGGTDDAREMYIRFRGEEPGIEALLKRKGFIE